MANTKNKSWESYLDFGLDVILYMVLGVFCAMTVQKYIEDVVVGHNAIGWLIFKVIFILCMTATIPYCVYRLFKAYKDFRS